MFNKLIFSANLKSKISGQDGHIWRFEGVANTIFSRRLNEKRSRIRPKLRWAERVKKDHTEISHRTKTKGGEDEWWRGVVERAERERNQGEGLGGLALQKLYEPPQKNSLNSSLGTKSQSQGINMGD